MNDYYVIYDVYYYSSEYVKNYQTKVQIKGPYIGKIITMTYFSSMKK